MDNTLISSVHYSLQHNLVINAVFMAERLCAQTNTEESKQLLATCYIRQGKLNQALNILQGCKSEMNRFLYAQCALKLDKLREAEQSLLHDPSKTFEDNLQEERSFTLQSVPCGSAGLYTLGLICKKQGQIERAKICLKKCLSLNPFMWVAFEVLASLDDPDEPAAYFGCETENISVVATEETPKVQSVKQVAPTEPFPETPTESGPSFHLNAPRQEKLRPFVSTPVLAGRLVRRIYEGVSPFLSTSNSISSFAQSNSQPSPFTLKTKNVPDSSLPILSQTTPGPTSSKLDIPEIDFIKKPNYQVKIPAIGTSNTNPAVITNTSATTKNAVATTTLTTPSTTAIFSTSTTVTTVINTTTPISTPTASVAVDTLRIHSEEIQNQQIDVNVSIEGTSEALSLLRILGYAYQHLQRFRCQQAIKAFMSLPPQQLNTGWVLCKISRAFYEMADYKMACKYFEAARRVDPCRTEDLEIYSTCLWQLRNEVDLSYLAQQLIALDRYCAATWCAVGNCFSLQKEHDSALKSFQRAAQSDPEFPYAHTLSGWGYVENDHWDKAMTCFRTAIGLDSRHYNAWYGLGTIYNRKQKYKAAEYHFRKAISVNKSNAVLYCQLGTVLLADKRPQEALQALETATLLDPKNGLAKFTKAKALYRLGKYKEALSILTILRDASPREVPLYLLMGKIHKKLGNVEEAVSCITTALDFDVKNSNEIKALLPKIRSSNTDVSDEEDGLENLS